MKPIAPESLVEHLCTTCGLCCNGVLFRNVRLRQADDPKRLRRLGLTMETKGTLSCLLQPCSAFDGSHCSLYVDRPSRCREFECHLLRRAADGAINLPTARRLIHRAQKLATKIQNDLEALGNRDTSRPLLERYAAVMASPIDLQAGPTPSRLRGRLLTRVDTFMRFAQTEFLGVSSDGLRRIAAAGALGDSPETQRNRATPALSGCQPNLPAPPKGRVGDPRSRLA